MTAKQKTRAINAPKNSHPLGNELRGWRDMSYQAKDSRVNRRQKRGWNRGRK